MNTVKLSDNYQVVIPKAARRQLSLEKGQQLYVQSVNEHSITFTVHDPVDRYQGTLKGVLPEDAIIHQRQMRRELDRS